jgi:hypothetical protein
MSNLCQAPHALLYFHKPARHISTSLHCESDRLHNGFARVLFSTLATSSNSPHSSFAECHTLPLSHSPLVLSLSLFSYSLWYASLLSSVDVASVFVDLG